MADSARQPLGALLWRSLGAGAEALRAHRLRSGLTTLGVVFGVAAVLCMMAIGKGAEQRVLSELRRLGVRNLHVEASAPPSPATSRGLVEEDARAIAGALGTQVEGTAPERFVDSTIWIGARRADVRLCGVTPRYASYLGLETRAGRFISDLDLERGAAVCVLSEALLATLLPAQEPIGSVMRSGGQAWRVVGAVRGAALAPERRPAVYVPLSSAWRMLPQRRDPRQVERIVVRLSPAVEQGAMARVLRASLERRHGGVLDFTVLVPSELIAREQRTQRIFQIVMGSIAGISLLVGGIGIMNILFASVVERTAEIGLRRAVGARYLDILAQFLFEACLIAGLGGLLGVLLGAGGALVVARSAHWPVLITPGSVALATGTALATGLVSGLVPARRAALMPAIEALRHE